MAISGRAFMSDLDRVVLVGDGAMGTMLYANGAFLNRPFEELNVTDRDRVVEVHHAYLEAGAELIETNTFGANRVKLANFGLRHRLVELNVAGVTLARQVADGRAYVAGAIGPLGVPMTSRVDAEAAFREQGEALLESGVDLVMLETFPALTELRAAVRAIRAVTTLPIAAQVTTNDDGLTIDGAGPEVFGPTLVDEGASVVGINCSAGPISMLDVVERLAGATSAPLVAQPNAGRPREVDGRTLSLSSPGFLAAYARRFAAVGIRLIGGCCGTTPDHIRSIRRMVAPIACEAETNTV